MGCTTVGIMCVLLKILKLALACVAQLIEHLPHKPKGRRFDSWSGHMLSLTVWFPIRALMKDNQFMFLSLFFSLPSPLPKPSLPFSLSKNNRRKYPWVRIKYIFMTF